MAKNYFSVFDLPDAFDIDQGDLERRYFNEQRRFHPDRLMGKSASERQHSIAQSMLVNEAYETLKSPLARANHLLALHGVTQDSAKPSQELLMEIMELRETLGEIRTPEDLHQFTQKNEKEVQAALTELGRAFTRPDIAGAATIATRLSYLLKINDEIRVRKKIVSS